MDTLTFTKHLRTRLARGWHHFLFPLRAVSYRRQTLALQEGELTNHQSCLRQNGLLGSDECFGWGCGREAGGVWLSFQGMLYPHGKISALAESFKLFLLM